jgi:hypothetical protein
LERDVGDRWEGDIIYERHKGKEERGVRNEDTKEIIFHRILLAFSITLYTFYNWKVSVFRTVNNFHFSFLVSS